MLLRIVRAKLHCIRVTGAELNYHGSITLDPDQCGAAGIYPMEFVDIWNKQSGARISTYVIYGEPGSRCCILNGAAARTCQPGDEVIIAASDYVRPEEIYAVKPRVLTFNPDNTISGTLSYDVFENPERRFNFRIIDESAERPTSAEGQPTVPVDVAALKADLRGRGWSDRDILDFVAKHLRVAALDAAGV